MDDGDIVLLHDVYDTSVDTASQTVDALTKQGHTFVIAEGLLID